MNGIELGRRLRAIFARERLCMIALSGFTGADIREGCLAAGFDEYLVNRETSLNLRNDSEEIAWN